jgi:hypothetical protein
MTSATPAARTAAQLHEAAEAVARLAARRGEKNDTQVTTAPAASQRLELAIARIEDLLSRQVPEPRDGDSRDLFRQACEEIVDAARDYLCATQPGVGKEPGVTP